MKTKDELAIRYGFDPNELDYYDIPPFKAQVRHMPTGRISECDIHKNKQHNRCVAVRNLDASIPKQNRWKTK